MFYRRRKRKETSSSERVSGLKMRRDILSKPLNLNLVSMIDMFTIILVFLLKSFSVSDVSLSPPRGIDLPQSTSERVPTISVKVDVSLEDITVEGRQVVSLRQGRLRGEDVQGLVIFALYRELRSISKAKAKAEKDDLTQKFDRRIILYADKNIPFNTLKRVLFTAGQAEFEGFRFSAVRKGNV